MVRQMTLKEQNKILIEALRDIHSGVPAMDRAEKTLRYLNIIEAEEMNQNQEDKKNKETQ
jgi:hypothetical protein